MPLNGGTVDVVEVLERRHDQPARFGEHDAQIWVALEHAGEDQEPQRPPTEEVDFRE